jgi:Uma2 family endonuclease
MSTALPATAGPTHKDLPDKDGVPVRNSFEPYQSTLLTEPLRPVLLRLRPELDFFIGQDCGIYWRRLDPPLRGVKSPDWYLVLGVPHLLDGEMRRSYVLQEELFPPAILLEYASGNGAEERDNTPWEGKFWIYEKIIRPGIYGIFEPERNTLEMYHCLETHLERMQPNAGGRYPISALGMELGLWTGRVHGYEMSWMRWWTPEGELLPTPDDSATMERARSGRLAAKLRELGVDPDTL